MGRAPASEMGNDKMKFEPIDLQEQLSKIPVDAEIDDPTYLYRVDRKSRLVQKTTGVLSALVWSPKKAYPHQHYLSIHSALPECRRIFSLSFWRNFGLAQFSHRNDYSYWNSQGDPAIISRIRRNEEALSCFSWVEDDSLRNQALLAYCIEDFTGQLFSSASVALGCFEYQTASGEWMPFDICDLQR